MDGYVKTKVENRIATIEFFHPAHNSLPGDLLSKLRNAIDESGSDDDVLLIVLRSGGERTFCAGASFHELSSIVDFEEGKNFFLDSSK